MLVHRINIILLFFLGVTIAAAGNDDVIDLKKNETSTSSTTRHRHSNIRGGVGAVDSGNALDDLDDILLKEDDDHDHQVEREAQQKCGSWKDCPSSNYRCIDYTCHRRCRTTQDCGSAYDVCSEGVCKSDIIPTCTTNLDCKMGQKCEGRICVSENPVPCGFSNQPCPRGYRCNTQTKKCAPYCTRVKDCQRGYRRCRANMCLPS